MALSTADQWEAQMATVIAAFKDEFDFLSIEIEPLGVQLEAAVVTSTQQKAAGMIGRTFDGFDAMLFVETHDNMVAMHNSGVEIPLLVAFFDAAGNLVDQFRLNADDPTPRKPKGWFRYALELPGSSEDLPAGARLKLAV